MNKDEFMKKTIISLSIFLNISAFASGSKYLILNQNIVDPARGVTILKGATFEYVPVEHGFIDSITSKPICSSPNLLKVSSFMLVPESVHEPMSDEEAREGMKSDYCKDSVTAYENGSKLLILTKDYTDNKFGFKLSKGATVKVRLEGKDDPSGIWNGIVFVHPYCNHAPEYMPEILLNAEDLQIPVTDQEINEGKSASYCRSQREDLSDIALKSPFDPDQAYGGAGVAALFKGLDNTTVKFFRQQDALSCINQPTADLNAARNCCKLATKVGNQCEIKVVKSAFTVGSGTGVPGDSHFRNTEFVPVVK